MLQVACGLFPVPLPPLDQTHQLEYPRIVRQGPTSNFQFSQSTFIIEVSSIKIFRTRKVRFARVGTEGGTLPEWPPPPAPGAQAFDRSQGSKERHGRKPVGQYAWKMPDLRETAWFNRSIASSKSFFPALLKNAGGERLLACA